MADPSLDIYLLLQKAARDSVSPIPVAVENVEFDFPSDVTHVQCQIRLVDVEDPVFGSKYRREYYQLQLFAVSKINNGIRDVLTIV